MFSDSLLNICPATTRAIYPACPEGGWSAGNWKRVGRIRNQIAIMANGDVFSFPIRMWERSGENYIAQVVRMTTRDILLILSGVGQLVLGINQFR